MTTQPSVSDPFVILYGIPWETYGRILDALGEYPLGHTYVKGTLEMRGLLYGVNWEDYQGFLEALGDYPLRHTYDRGTLEMMTPRKDHDWIKSLIGRMIEYMVIQLDIPIQSIGSTTLSGEDVERGFQPDEAYYVANEPLVRGKRTYDPDLDPPPDLIVEVDVTHSSVPRLPSFASLKIAEVWRHSGDEVRFLHLTEGGQYEEKEFSRNFPFLASQDLTSVLRRCEEMDENSLVRMFAELAGKRYERFEAK